ncbi:MAG TPA: DUF2779 domain-containing protein [Pyrinomonadaceae bacterium]|nr:DUF2779 domain-containing protein [Pyrinomonadaceae bacterium]
MTSPYKLSKSDFLEYLRCPQEFWLKHHHPELFVTEKSLIGEHFRAQGDDVERLARTLKIFDGKQLEYQREFITDKLRARSDIVVTDPATGKIEIYEVKSGSKIKDEYVIDVAFQKIAAERTGANVERTFVITVDTGYVRNGDIVPDQLLRVTDVTDNVNANQPLIEQKIDEALNQLNTEPNPDITVFCADKLECAFITHHFRDIPAYNVTHIRGIYKPKLSELIARGILDIRHVPTDFKISERQRTQVEIAIANRPHVRADEIKATLRALKLPLRFFDYETFGYAVPQYHGIKPYQHVPVQFSLHTMRGVDQLEHAYHIAGGNGVNPGMEITEALHNAIEGEIGTVVVWNASFEKGRNREGKELHPEFAEFLQSLNDSMFDLETIFGTLQLYAHPGFLGRTSLKAVLPVIAPHLSYNDLEIVDGQSASIRWYRMTSGKLTDDERSEIHDHLKAYCDLDTLAMVEIYKFLMKL